MGQYIIKGSTAEEIISSIKQGIGSNELPPRSVLPTVRELARKLGVNRNTVSSAYRRLSEEGLIQTNGRRGSHIIDKSLSQNGLKRYLKVNSLASGDPDFALLPDVASAISRQRYMPHKYDDPTEIAELLDMARDFFKKDRIPHDHITFTSGAYDAIREMLLEKAGAEDRVVVEDPCMMTSLYLLRSLHIEPIGVEQDGNGILPEALDRTLKKNDKIKAVIITPYAQNPTGSALSSERAREITEILNTRPEILVIEDDHYWPLTGEERVTVTEGLQCRWAVVRSLSKTFGPDIRFAFVTGDMETVHHIRMARGVGPRWVSWIIQGTVLEILSDPQSFQIFKKARRIYDERRRALLEALHSYGIQAVAPTGQNVWLHVDDEATIAQTLSAQGWIVRQGNIFTINSSPGIRVTISCLTPVMASDFARVLDSSIKRLQVNAGA